MKLHHPGLVDLLQKAYSAEKAAAFAYQGHAGSVKNNKHKAAIRQIELDEWNHRMEVLEIMRQYDVPVSKYYELRFHVIGKIISGSCYVSYPPANDIRPAEHQAFHSLCQTNNP